MQIEMKPLTSIRPYASNPRLNDAAVGAVAAWDRKQPTVWDIESKDRDADTVHGTQKPVE